MSPALLSLRSWRAHRRITKPSAAPLPVDGGVFVVVCYVCCGCCGAVCSGGAALQPYERKLRKVLRAVEEAESTLANELQMTLGERSCALVDRLSELPWFGHDFKFTLEQHREAQLKLLKQHAANSALVIRNPPPRVDHALITSPSHDQLVHRYVCVSIRLSVTVCNGLTLLGADSRRKEGLGDGHSFREHLCRRHQAGRGTAGDD
jgi:hypothetical protein